MQGTRIEGDPLELKNPGDYGMGRLEADGDPHWFALDPHGNRIALCNHLIEEHEDETITARHPRGMRPSIETKSWSGELVDGEWRES